MHLPEDGVLLRVFVGESDTWEGKSLYRAIVEEARRMNLAGATVLRGIMGFGAASRIHTTRFLRLSEDLPIVIEIVDTRERVEEILPFLDRVVKGGLVTMEKARVIRYRHGGDDE